MSYEFITTERRGNILSVTLNRPEVYNAVHPTMHHELAEFWDRFATDPDLWVAVLTGAGDKAFTAGNDLKFTAAGGKETMPMPGFAGLSQRFDLEKPFIAAVNGFAMEGGFETALSCDIILSADTAIVALPEVRVGFFAAAGGVQRLSRYIGRLAAQELVLTGPQYDGRRGAVDGGVNAVVPKAEGLPESLLYSCEVVADLAQTEDFKEGVQAFVEKRKANWVNR